MRSVSPPPANPGETYYVIVGCGVSAAVNYTTLLASGKDPFGGHEVLFIGEHEPWGEYDPLPMGQWPAILATPSFERQLRSINQNDFVPSDEFAERIDHQWAWLYATRPFHYSRGLVTSVTDHPKVGFDVTWDDNGSVHQVHAAHLDICGGPGPSRRLCPNQVGSGLWPYPDASRLLETGESYLSQSGRTVAKGERVAVIGGGPTAAWCVERALVHGNKVEWFSRGDLNPAFVSSLRNDALIRLPVTRTRKDRLTTITERVVPASPDLVFAEFYDVVEVSKHDHVSVDVYFDRLPGNRRVNSEGLPRPALGRGTYEQVILALGQETGLKRACKHNKSGCALTIENNSWATRLDPVLSLGSRKRRRLITRKGIAVGLRSYQGDLRVLGAAFLAHPHGEAVFEKIDSELFHYIVSLPEQAQVNRSAAVAAMTTALANGYFDSRPNLNRNTATLDQLAAIPGLAKQFAEFLHDVRTYRINPVTDAEASDVAGLTSDRYS